MTEFEPTEWEGRLKAAVEKTLQQRAQKRALRAQLAENRLHGLAQRHGQKLARIRRAEKEKSMTTTTTEKLPWTPVLVFSRDEEHCTLCNGILDLTQITLGTKDGGPVCEDCAEKLPDVGAPLWKLAKALDQIDSAIFQLPQRLRPGIATVAMDMISKILEWRLGPITDEEKTKFVADMAAADKMLQLPGGRCVKAAEYDPERHGPFLP